LCWRILPNLSYTSSGHFVMSSLKFLQILFFSVKRKESVFCSCENVCCCSAVLRSAACRISWGGGKVHNCKALRIRFYVFYEEAIWCRTGPMTIKSFVYCHGCLWRLYHPDLNFRYESFSLFSLFIFIFSPPAANFVLLRSSIYIYIYIYIVIVFLFPICSRRCVICTFCCFLNFNQPSQIEASL